ncbi:MAG: glycosyltransferase [Bryobacterales bacterium]|nr:glycosyltransferase [Bryobacterales bacterium]
MAALAIHHVLDTLAVGGAEVLVSALARAQKKAGHEVAVHCIAGAGPLAADLERAAIPVRIHARPRRALTLVRLFLDFRGGRPDVVHCHNIAPTVLGALAATLARVPCIVATRHGTATRNPRFERKFWLAARLCHRVVAVSRSAAERLAVAAWARADKLVLIPNGAPAPAPPPPGTSPAGRTDAFTLISVGRLHRVKDYPTLLRAVAPAAVELPALRLLVLGDGPERERLESLANALGLAGHVRFLGVQRDVGRWLASADAFVLASISEGLPLALIEALAAGLPAIVTDVGGMPEVVRCCGSGIVVPPAQPEALAGAIVALARDPARLRSLSEAARRCYAAHFTLDRMVADYFRLYLDILSFGL